MSIAVPLYGFGIGGSSLYYSVVCSTTEPAKKEGRIWVKSSVPMTQFEVGNNWSTAKVGVVVVGGTPGGANPTSANKTLDLINTKVAGIQNRLKLTPGACLQVQGSVGNWVSVDAYVCHSDTWIQFSSVFSATINITYPAGSTCTCSDGTTTLSAPDTSGTWACIVPNAGTWTVTSTSGTETDSKAVTITTDGQSTSVELRYALFLFKPNAPSDIIAGEWEMPVNSAVTAEAELTVKSVNNYNGNRLISARTKGQIDLTEYSTLQATCKASGGSDTKLEVYSGSSVVASTAIGTDLTTVTVDISALSGLHSIGFGGSHTAYETITYTATEIKLLK